MKMPSSSQHQALIAAALVLLTACACAEEPRRFSKGDFVPLWANKVGPITAPSESYAFYDKLPWCRASKVVKHPLHLGEALSGDRIVMSPYNFKFGVDEESKNLCEVNLSAKEVDSFHRAIHKHYSYDFMIEPDLSVLLFIGEIGPKRNVMRDFVYSHISFYISYHNDEVVELSATPDNPSPLVLGEGNQTIKFTYSTTWRLSEDSYASRRQQYRDAMELRFRGTRVVHWTNIFDSLTAVLLFAAIFVVGLIAIVRRDIKGHRTSSGNTRSAVGQAGWQQLASDVFRFPPALLVLCPVLGTGVQLLVLSCLLIILGMFEIFNPLSRGTLQTTLLFSYSFTAWVAGYTSSYMYHQSGGKAWVANALMTVAIYSGPVAIVITYLQSVALVYGSTRAIPVWTLLTILALWAIVTIPLTLIGAVLGRKNSKPIRGSPSVSKIARDIPRQSLWRKPVVVVAMCGLLPFLSIQVELTEAFSAVNGSRFFHLYEVLSISFVVLNLVCVVATIAAIYFQLASQDHRWWWSSVLYGGSVGVYSFAYAVYFYVFESPFRGFLQSQMFLGYALLISLSFALMGGTVGYFSTRLFVVWLYSHLKVQSASA
jgi:Endomembrane protein 70